MKRFSVGAVVAALSLTPIPDADASGIGLGGIGAVSAGGALASGGAALPVAGAAQIVGGVVCFFLDPPDLANATVPVDLSDFTGFRFPSALTLDPTLPIQVAAAQDVFAGHLDDALAFARAQRTSLDRLEGALILGDPIAEEARRQEARAFGRQAQQALEKARQAFRPYLLEFDMAFPGVLDTILTKDDVKDMRDQLAAGVFPDFEQVALDAYQVTDLEKQHFAQQMSGLLDSDIDALFALLDPLNGEAATLRDALPMSFDATCADCRVVPLPVSGVLALSGFASIALMRVFGSGRSSGGPANPRRRGESDRAESA